MGGNPHLHCELPDFKGYLDFIFSLDLLNLGAAMASLFLDFRPIGHEAFDLISN